MIYLKKYVSLVLLLLLFCINATAQKRLIKGYVHDSITGVPIVNAIISNEMSKKMVTPDQNGFFSITASRGDQIIINAFNYNFDTLRATSRVADTVRIQLLRTSETLQGVTVTTTQGYNRYQIDSLHRREAFVSDMGGIGKMPAVSKADNMGAGVGINLDAFARKRTKDRDKAYSTFNYLEKQAYIDYRFSPQNISQITGLKGDSLVSFMRQYTPSYDWLRQHPANEDVLYYVNDKMKVFANKP